jgi:type I restriction enzyme M protein
VLDRFKLAGVIATWWTETLPEFKTLLENGFSGVIDGWVDAIADAVEDDEATGPTFDPFAHKLVRRMMSDYLEQIAAAKTEVARLRGEKEAFEQSNEPDDADEEELKKWSYARDLERQIRELKVNNKDALKELANLEKAAAKALLGKRKPPSIATGAEGVCLQTAKASLQPVLDQIAALEAALVPYEQIKRDLATARARFRKLTDAFVFELKNRCGFMGDEKKRALVLDLLEQDVQVALDASVSERRQALTWLIESLWDKYRVTFNSLTSSRSGVMVKLDVALDQLGYTR